MIVLQVQSPTQLFADLPLEYNSIEESYIQNATRQLLKSYGDKIEEVKSRSTIENANTIFTDKHLNIKDSYKDDLAKYLFAEVQQVDFAWCGIALIYFGMIFFVFVLLPGELSDVSDSHPGQIDAMIPTC